MGAHCLAPRCRPLPLHNCCFLHCLLLPQLMSASASTPQLLPYQLPLTAASSTTGTLDALCWRLPLPAVSSLCTARLAPPAISTPAGANPNTTPATPADSCSPTTVAASFLVSPASSTPAYITAPITVGTVASCLKLLLPAVSSNCTACSLLPATSTPALVSIVVDPTPFDLFLSHDERPAPAAGGLTGDNVDAGEVSC